MVTRSAPATALFALALAFGLLPAAARAAGPAKRDLVAGAGVVRSTGWDLALRVEANSGPTGEDPRGTFALSQTGVFSISGDVTCLFVSANNAFLGGVVQRSDDPAYPVGSGVAFALADTGHGGGNRPPDVISLGGSFPSPPAYDAPICGFNLIAAVLLELTTGNFVVMDAAP